LSYRNELIQVAAVAVAALQDLDTGTTYRAGWNATHESNALREITDERRRQEKKWGTRSESPRQWLTILMEEVGEVARAILERDGV